MSFTNIIGSGPIFPISLTQDQEGNTLWGTLAGDMEIIKSDILGLLAHSLGDMIRQEDVGHRLLELLEEPHNEVLIQLTKNFCISLINNHESRIKPLTPNDIVVKSHRESISILISAILKTGDKLEPINININKIA